MHAKNNNEVNTYEYLPTEQLFQSVRTTYQSYPVPACTPL